MTDQAPAEGAGDERVDGESLHSKAPGSLDPDSEDTDEVAESRTVDELIPDTIDPGETLFHEPGGSWWVVAIGPVLILAVLIMEITGPGQVHWLLLSIFGVVVVGFSVLQVVAARKHVSVTLTETLLQQGTKTIKIDDIEMIFPANNGPNQQDWEISSALGELHAVPRRRKGVGVRLRGGKLAQAWARDVDRFRVELTEAYQAVKMGLPPRGTSD